VRRSGGDGRNSHGVSSCSLIAHRRGRDRLGHHGLLER
jgi:hypothetical protein